MRKLTAFFIASVIFISSVSTTIAAYSTQKEYKSKVSSITLEEALKEKFLDENKEAEEKPINLVEYKEKDGKLIIPIEDALKNIEYTDPEIKLYDRKLELYKKQYYMSLSEAVSAEVYEYQKSVDNKKRELLNWRIKFNDYENLKHDRNDVIHDIKLNFEKNYVKGIQLQKDKAVSEQELSKLETTIKQNQLRLELGLIKASDLDKLNSTKAQLLAQLKSIERQLDLVTADIKQSLGIDSSKEISLVPFNKSYEKFDDNLIEQRIKDTAQNSYNLEKLRNKLYLTRLEHQIETDPIKAGALEASIEELEHTIKMNPFEEEAKLLKSYYALKNLEDNIEIQRINLDIARRNLEDIKIKIKLGKATSMDELTASINVSTAENKLQSLINEYMFTQAAFAKSLEAKAGSETSK